MLAVIQSVRKNVLLIYLPTVRQWTIDTRQFTNSECLFFFLKKGKPTQGYLVFVLAVKGGNAIYWPKYKEEDIFLLVHLLTVI